MTGPDCSATEANSIFHPFLQDPSFMISHLWLQWTHFLPSWCISCYSVPQLIHIFYTPKEQKVKLQFCLLYSVDFLRLEFQLSNNKQFPCLILMIQMAYNLLVKWLCSSIYLVSHLIDENAHEVRISLFPATKALVTRVVPALIPMLMLIHKG